MSSRAEDTVTRRMPALVFDGRGGVHLREIDVPTPGAGEVLLEVDAVGLCGSDLGALGPSASVASTSGAVLGHEVSATVVDAADPAEPLIGARVVVHPNVTCGRCDACRGGHRNLCPSQHTLGLDRPGGAARYMVAPATMIHGVPNGLDSTVAALAEPLACVLNGIDKAQPRVGDSSLVVGAGPVGLLFCAALRAAGVDPVYMSESTSYRAELARRVGASEVIDPSEDVAALISERTEGRGVDIVVDAVGGQLALAVDVAASAGRVLVFGAHRGTVEIDPIRLLYRELVVLGVFTALDTFPRAIRMIEKFQELLSSIVTHRLPLQEFDHAVELMRSGQTGKVVLTP